MATPVLLRELAVSPKLWQALCDREEENNHFAIAKEFFDQRDVKGAPSLAQASVNTHASTSFHSTYGRDTNGTLDDSQLDTQIEPPLKKQDLPVLGFALQAARRSCRDRGTAFSFDEVTAEPLGIMLVRIASKGGITTVFSILFGLVLRAPCEHWEILASASPGW